VSAELAGIDVGQIVARRAPADGPLDLQDGFRKLSRSGLIHFQDEKCEALRRFRADAGKFPELFDEPVDRFCDVHS